MRVRILDARGKGHKMYLENANIFWIIFMLTGAVVMFMVGLVFRRNTNLEKKCTTCVVGEIIRYSMVAYNGIHLPVVKYAVVGKEYTVVGPKTEYVVKSTVSTPFSENSEKTNFDDLDEDEKLPNNLHMKQSRNSMFGTENHTSFWNRYPIGKMVEVYYNPSKPKMAYVERSPYGKMTMIIEMIAFASSFLMVFLAFGTLFVKFPG